MLAQLVEVLPLVGQLSRMEPLSCHAVERDRCPLKDGSNQRGECLHAVRHSYASVGLARASGWGWEVQVISERLGHASIGVTLDSDSHVLPGRDAHVAETLATAILDA